MTKDTEALNRPYPQLLDQSEAKALLIKAENLWSDLQANNLGGFSGVNRPFYILHEFRSVIEEFGNRDVGLSWSKDQLNAAKAPAPDTIGSHFGNGGGLDPVAGGGAVVAWLFQKGGYKQLSYKPDSAEPEWQPLYAHPPHPAPVDSDEAVRLLRGIVRLSEMGFEASMREPEEDGNYAVYTRAKAFLDGHPSSVALSEALRDIPDEVYRHIAESKDVGNARSRVADLVAQLPLTTPVDPVAGGEALREALRRAALRLEICAGYIDSSFGLSGTRRAERAMKAKHFALEALAALKGPAA